MRSEGLGVIEGLYRDALRLSGARRDSFLAGACAGDEELRRKVEALIAFGESADNFLEEPAFGAGMKLLAREAESLVGRRVGPYTVLNEVGCGGMGTVYRAKDHELDRDVALKALSFSWAQDEERVQRFRQEARLAAKIIHQNVAHVYRPVEDGGRYFLAMELVQGVTLRELLNGGSLDTRRAVRVAVQVAAGLAAAHAKGVVHRDIKPENIMVCQDDEVKVLDFGLAKITRGDAGAAARPNDTATIARDTAVEQTEFGAVLGTAEYMSPEQALGGEVDERSDVWGLGVVLYEMLCGHTPFKGANKLGSIAEILKTELPTRIPRMPAALERIVKKALAKDVADRYQKVKEMQAELHQLLDEMERGIRNPFISHRGRQVLAGAAVAVCASLLTAAATISLLKREGGAPALPTSLEWQLQRRVQGEGPNRVINLSDIYGKAGLTIFNKKTRAVFANHFEFFQDSGIASFDLPLKFEEYTELPKDLRRWNDKDFPVGGAKAIEAQTCPPEICAQ